MTDQTTDKDSADSVDSLARLIRSVEPDPAYLRPAALDEPPTADSTPLSYLESDGSGTYRVCQAYPSRGDKPAWLTTTLAYRASILNAVYLIDGMRALRGEGTS